MTIERLIKRALLIYIKMKVKIDGKEYVPKDVANKIRCCIVRMTDREMESDAFDSLDEAEENRGYRKSIIFSGKKFVIGYDKVLEELDVYWEEH